MAINHCKETFYIIQLDNNVIVCLINKLIIKTFQTVAADSGIDVLLRC